MANALFDPDQPSMNWQINARALLTRTRLE
jgi:hypothetical protein